LAGSSRTRTKIAEIGTIVFSPATPVAATPLAIVPS